MSKGASTILSHVEQARDPACQLDQYRLGKGPHHEVNPDGKPVSGEAGWNGQGRERYAWGLHFAYGNGRRRSPVVEIRFDPHGTGR
jgi:hypothetical protein